MVYVFSSTTGKMDHEYLISMDNPHVMGNRRIEDGDYLSNEDNTNCVETMAILDVSEEQRQLASSLLALANEEPQASKFTAGSSDRTQTNSENNGSFPIYLCSICSASFDTISDCEFHVKTAHPKILTTKKKLSSTTTNSSEQKQPTSSRRTQNDEIKCPIKGCLYQFSKINLQKHLDCHNPLERFKGQKNQFSCPNCQINFKNWRTCALHLWRQHQVDVDLLTCPVCNEYKTLFAASLQVHMLTHSEARRFVCSVCRKGFKQLAQLQNHSVIHLDKDKDMVPQWYSKKLCKECSKYFADSKSLKKHIQAVHTKLKPYICQVCNHQSSRKSMLEMHMRQHTGEKPFSCDTCDYKTGDHNSLRRHKLRHLGERPYKCPFCSYGSIQSSSYKAHVLKKHPDNVGKTSKVFVCSDCLFKTVCLDIFISHQSVHKTEVKISGSDQSEMTKESDVPNTDESSCSAKGVETVLILLPNDVVPNQNGFVVNRKPLKKSLKKTTPKEMPTLEEEDSLHATTDFGGVTIPADSI